MPEDRPGFLSWLFGAKQETPSEAEARKKKEAADAQARANIQKAIQGYGTLKKVVKDSDAANKKTSGTK